MNKDVRLVPMTVEMYHAYFKEYENDPDLYMDKTTYKPYVYEEAQVNRYIQKQIDLNRKVFAIVFQDQMVGELIIKNIRPHESATLSLALKNSTCKNRGFGTRAEQLAIQYVFQELDIPLLYADAILTNTRSQHVLEKVGFRSIKEEGDFKYYCIRRNCHED